jgi:hypothetical protein
MEAKVSLQLHLSPCRLQTLLRQENLVIALATVMAIEPLFINQFVEKSARSMTEGT